MDADFRGLNPKTFMAHGFTRINTDLKIQTPCAKRLALSELLKPIFQRRGIQNLLEPPRTQRDAAKLKKTEPLHEFFKQ